MFDLTVSYTNVHLLLSSINVYKLIVLKWMKGRLAGSFIYKTHDYTSCLINLTVNLQTTYNYTGDFNTEKLRVSLL